MAVVTFFLVLGRQGGLNEAWFTGHGAFSAGCGVRDIKLVVCRVTNLRGAGG